MASQRLLLKALEDGDEATYDRLMRRVFKPSIKAVDEDGNTCLHWAVVGDQLSLLRRVLDKGIAYSIANKIGDTPAHWAAQLNRTRGLRYLLSRPQHDANVLGHAQQTPLHRAAMFGHTHAVKELLELGADANIQDKDKRLPLHLACHHGHDDVIASLVPLTASVSAQDCAGDTPAHVAARRGYGSIVGQLQEAGADLKVKNSKGQTVLETKSEARSYSWMSNCAKTLATTNLQSRPVEPKNRIPKLKLQQPITNEKESLV
eukprot:TRINITY_DN7061_c0_g1_i1.p1 TRINITY_DN7061_c0_g1~~TRINITY_DN7061_c0_g1_i1.p1  ORF type:complete len:261 (+),score=46.12 TRINITY_DN7061_c0_g1_i1:169-951(+)